MQKSAVVTLVTVADFFSVYNRHYKWKKVYGYKERALWKRKCFVISVRKQQAARAAQKWGSVGKRQKWQLCRTS
jgi:hypothetical protein